MSHGDVRTQSIGAVQPCSAIFAPLERTRHYMGKAWSSRLAFGSLRAHLICPVVLQDLICWISARCLRPRRLQHQSLSWTCSVDWTLPHPMLCGG